MVTMKQMMLVIACLWLFGCAESKTETVILPFSLNFEGQEVTCSSALQVNALTLYIHDLALQELSGQWQKVELDNALNSPWQNESIALLDLAPCQTNQMGLTSVVMKVKPGQYRGVRFRIGVPEALNHQDPQLARAPLDINQLQWHWTVGYKFAYFDLAWREQTVKHHLGSSGCVGNIGDDIQCKYQNRPEIVLPSYQLGQPIKLELRQFFTELPHARCFGKPQDKGCDTLFNLLGLQDAPQRIFRLGA